ncbi:MAG: altronate dehydrogenase [Burkholderiales bacterium]|nr:altronate dehydrogenase [Opitutaceae bacterium]
MSETILQFGAGNFLRAFADLFVAQANRSPATAVGRIVVVQSTDRHRADALNAAQGRYHVALQGFVDGRVIDTVEPVGSISRALHAGSQWAEVRAFAQSPDLRFIFSNTTEAGFALDERDTARPTDPTPPHSFPAKLLDVLLTRHAAGLPAPTVVPCELIEQNGQKLRALVLTQAARWKAPPAAVGWLADAVCWLDNLVDRIVPGAPVEHPLKATDPLLLSAEPFAFWGVQGSGPFLSHPAITLTTDLTPYYLRKVRILNGAHTALVAHAIPLGLKTVRECLEHAEVGPWLQRVLFEEIVPAIADRAPEAEAFARTTLDRFRNPFLNHQLSSIALNHDAKLRTRLLPTLADYQARFQRPAPLLSALLS